MAPAALLGAISIELCVDIPLTAASTGNKMRLVEKFDDCYLIGVLL